MTMLASTSGINANRVRLMFRFWLDVAKDMQSDLADWLSSLKEQREMKPTILDALLLFFDLSQGRTEQLNRLFPFVLQAAPIPGGERPTSRLNTPLVDLEKEAAKLEIKQASKGDVNPNANFRISMAKLQADNHLDKTLKFLTPDDIAYGVKKGLLPAHVLPTVTSTPKEIKKIEGSEIALKVPTFDDDLDLI